MKKFLAKLWSYSLILPVTDDNNFGTNEMGNGDKERTSYRISLFGFFWGHKAKYLLTYNFKNKRFSFYHEITLEQCGLLKEHCDDEKIANKSQDYEKHLSDKEMDNHNIEFEAEFIQYANSRQHERIELGERKINLYATVILAIIPILLVLFNINIFLSYNLFEKVLAIYVIYFLLNVILMIFDSMKVKGYVYSRFSDLKKAKDKRKKLSSNYYFDWQMNKDSADIMISYVLNIQDLIKYAILLAVILTLSYNIRIANVFDIPKLNTNNSAVITVEIDELNNPYSKDSIELTKLLLSIQTKEYNNLIVLSSNSNDKNVLSRYFTNYDKNLIKFHHDESLDKNTIKIIKE